MLLNIIRQFNWVDVLVVIILFRICYISAKIGFPIEIFKLLGTVSAVYLSMHYYIILSDLIARRIPTLKEMIPLEFRDFLCFVILALLGYLVFTLFRALFYRFMKMEAVPKVSKWGGLILGIGRGILLASLMIFLLTISSVSYLKDKAIGSYFGKRLFQVAPSTYSWVWNSVASKFMAIEKFNDTVLEVQENFSH